MSIEWYGDAIAQRIRQGAMAGVMSGIGMIEDRAVELIMSPPKTGHVYRRRGVVHQASAPGEAPASDTGTLVNGRRIDLATGQLGATLTFTTKHAAYLEFGTKHMEPRPFARRAVMEKAEDVRGTIAASIRAALR